MSDTGAPAPAAGQVFIHTEVTHMNFMLGEILPGADGTRTLPIFFPNGELHLFPIAADDACAIGRQLLAPSIETVSSGIEVPGFVPSPSGER